MVGRVWRGVVRREDGDAYAALALDNGLAAYAAAPGNRGAWILRRDDGDRTEFIAFTLWDSAASVRAFAGAEVDTGVAYPEDELYLLDGGALVRESELAGSL